MQPTPFRPLSKCLSEISHKFQNASVFFFLHKRWVQKLPGLPLYFVTLYNHHSLTHLSLCGGPFGHQTSVGYQHLYDLHRKREHYSRFHGYAYDGIWTVAVALQAVNRKIKTKRRSASLANFRYRDPDWGRVFLEALNETAFEGVTVSECPEPHSFGFTFNVVAMKFIFSPFGWPFLFLTGSSQVY